MNPLRAKLYRRPEMNLVPLIDVLVMLIFFAFVTMQFKVASNLNITLPTVRTAGKNNLVGKTEISIGKDGRISFNGELINEQDLDQLLAQLRRVNRDTPILIRADEGSAFGKYTFVVDALRKAGFRNATIGTR